jgi:multidrug efflux pump subunit AcrA (membrane-fusion protein)
LLIVFALILLAGIGGLAWYYLNKGTADAAVSVVTTKVVRGPFEQIVLEQGTVESSDSYEIRCEVQSTSAVKILEVVDEGKQVSKGDELAKLDSSSLDKERVQQRIVCNSAHAAVIQAENTLRAAEISRIEYLEGAFKQEEQGILGEIFVAEENLRRAQLAFQSTERLAAKGIVTALQLEGDQFAVEKAKNELEVAKTKLNVLRKYTKEKMLKQFDSDIATAQAQWDSEKESYKLEIEKLLDAELQIARCTIVLGKIPMIVGEGDEKRVELVDDPEAPDHGQVVYANKYSSRGGSAEFVVEPGATPRENQALIRLPDPSSMQVKATINESRISLVAAGMRAELTLDALKGQVLPGVVTKVNQYAEPGSWSSGNIKEYAAFVDILAPPDEIRSGMNAEVRIYVQNLANALQVPVQTLCEVKGHFFCLVKNGSEFETREVQVGVSNDRFMTIESGLTEGETLVMNPRAYPDKLQLPDLPDEPQVPDDSDGPTQRKKRPSQAAGGEDGPVAGPEGRAPDGGGAGGGDFDPERIFAALDADGDGKVSGEEIPDRMRDNLSEIDTDQDGAVSREEWQQRRSARSSGGGGGGRPQP